MAGAWTTADYALIVSLSSAAVSLVSLGWNIVSKFIFPKSKVRLRIGLFLNVPDDGISFELGADENLPEELTTSKINYPAAGITITNFGPQVVSLSAIYGESRKWFWGPKKNSRFSLYRNYPPSDSSDTDKWIKYGGLGGMVQVEVGKPLVLYFPVTPSMFERLSMNDIVVLDGLERAHYVGKNAVQKLRSQVKKYVVEPVT